MSKKQTLKDTFLRDLWDAGTRRIERGQPAAPGKEISGDLSVVFQVLAPLGWLDKFHQTADPRTREAMLTCFLMGRDTQRVQLGEKFFLNAKIGWKMRRVGKRAARARFGTAEERKQRAIELKPEFDRLTSGPDKKSKKSALRILAKAHNCHPLTIRRQLDLLKPPQKNGNNAFYSYPPPRGITNHVPRGTQENPRGAWRKTTCHPEKVAPVTNASERPRRLCPFPMIK